MKALFLSHENLLSSGGGGNQICSREYRNVLAAAGFDMRLVTHGTDQSLATRLQRKLFPSRYPKLVPEAFWSRVQKASQEDSPGFVFCNFSDYIPLAERLRGLLPANTKMVLLSHGLSSVDDVHRERIASTAITAANLKRLSPRVIGNAIVSEMKGLPFFDHVFCLAEFEVPICRWLGARSVSWWPRTIPQGRELDWRPVGNRIGLVGTLDHPPNLEGVHKLCHALKQHGNDVPRLRLVTRSAAVATDLKSRYEFVDDLGPLEIPGELEAEAATWCAYVHPIFCLAMGCSTKLATGIAWGLPVLTTEEGIRGYAWEDGNLLLAADAEEMARMAIQLRVPSFAAAIRTGTLKVLSTGPSPATVSGMFRQTLHALLRAS